jgi:hypothetical protein
MGLFDGSTDITAGMALLAHILGIAEMAMRPRPSLYEGWQREAGIDPLVWGTATVGTGVVARDTLEAPYLKVLITGNAPLDEATLFGLVRWYCAPDPSEVNYLDEYIIRRTHFEFVAKLTLANLIDNTWFFMGFGFAQNVDEAAPNIIGFSMDGADNLQAICADLAGATVLPFLAAADTLDWHKYHIEVRRGEIHFYLDDIHIASIAANLPNYSMYPVFHIVQENNPGMCLLEVAALRIWVEDALI